MKRFYVDKSNDIYHLTRYIHYNITYTHLTIKLWQFLTYFANIESEMWVVEMVTFITQLINIEPVIFKSQQIYWTNLTVFAFLVLAGLNGE